MKTTCATYLQAIYVQSNPISVTQALLVPRNHSTADTHQMLTSPGNELKSGLDPFHSVQGFRRYSRPYTATAENISTAIGANPWEYKFSS